MGRKPRGNVPITRRISPAYVAMLEQLEAAGFALEAVIASARSLLWTAATHTNYDPFDYKSERQGELYQQMNALTAKDLYGEDWSRTFELAPESFRPFDEVYMDRIGRNLEKHRAYLTYLKARRADEADKGPGGRE